MSEHHGSCHCGRIRLTLRETPPDRGECNCSICRRTGGLVASLLARQGDG
jgi:hypothetical protein